MNPKQRNMMTARLDETPFEAIHTKLISLIESRHWPELLQSFKRTSNVVAARHLREHPLLFGANLLHIALRNRSPESVVVEIVKVFPETVSTSDHVRRTPLHVAAALRSSSVIIKRLVEAYPDACTMKDVDGKTPLMFACELHCAIYETDSLVPSHRSRLDVKVIHMLAKKSPESVGIEDDDEMNAIEYALLSNADDDIIRFLQQKCARYCRMSNDEKRSAKWKYALNRRDFRTSESSATCVIDLQ